MSAWNDRRAWLRSPVLLASVLLIGLSLVLRVAFAVRRRFDADELEHLHVAWCWTRDLLPFRDFFEVHPPLFHILLAPLVALLGPEVGYPEARATLIAARLVMILAWAGILALVVRIGTRLADRPAGLLAGAFASVHLLFLHRSLEVRPDPLASLLVLGCVALLLPAAGSTAPPTRRRFAAAGALFGLAFCATQKVAFLLPGLLLALGLYPFLEATRDRRAEAENRVLYCLAGMAAPLALLAAYFQARGGLVPLLEHVFLLPLRWPWEFSPLGDLVTSLKQNPELALFGIAGWGYLVHLAVRARDRRFERALVAAVLLSAAVGLFVISIPYKQYYLLGLPLMFVAAGVLASRLLCSIRPGSSPWGAWAAALLVLAVGLTPLVRTAPRLGDTHAEQLSAIRFVAERSGPEETFLDGWTGYALFRPHAFFQWKFHGENRALLDRSDRDRIARDLASDSASPDWVILDRHLDGISPEISALLRSRYESVGREPFRKRRR